MLRPCIPSDSRARNLFWKDLTRESIPNLRIQSLSNNWDLVWSAQERIHLHICIRYLPMSRFKGENNTDHIPDRRRSSSTLPLPIIETTSLTNPECFQCHYEPQERHFHPSILHHMHLLRRFFQLLDRGALLPCSERIIQARSPAQQSESCWGGWWNDSVLQLA